MPLRTPHLARVVLAALVLLAGGCRNHDADPVGPNAFPFEGSWVDFVDPAHTLDIRQGEYLGEAGGSLTGTESFAPDGPAYPFAGPFFAREMVVRIERPGGPVTFVGELLDTDMLLMTSERPDEFLLVRRPEVERDPH